VFGVKKGGSAAYQEAKARYDAALQDGPDAAAPAQPIGSCE
jgi:hypothetical protein